MNTLENDLDLHTAENLKLKALTFDLDYKINHYTILIDQASKKLKLLNDKFTRLTNDLHQANSLQDKELRKVTADLEQAKKEVERLRRENTSRIEDLRRLESENANIQNEKYELQIEDMEREYREDEALRKAA